MARPSPSCAHDDDRLRLPAASPSRSNSAEKKESTDPRLSQLCPPYVTPSSSSSLEYHRSDARIVENGFAAGSGMSNSAKVGLGPRPRDGSVVSSLHCMNDPQPEGHMASHIGRREFLATLLGGAAAWPLAARAQLTERVRRIGLLMGVADDREGQARVTALKQGLQELGWTDGRNIEIETRFAGADTGRIRAHAAELVALAPDVIVT